jgi:uncharacterized protein with HEPN domain
VSDTQKYLNDLLEHLKIIQEFTADGYDSFVKDRKTQFAVIRAYELVGEITKRLPQELLDTQPQIEWAAIRGFRDFLAHNYDRVKLSIVWGSVEKLPELRQAVEKMIHNLQQDTPEE